MKLGSGEAVVLDGVPGRVYEAIPRYPLTERGIIAPIIFSPDGKRIAYVAKKNGRSLVVVDGVEGPSFDRVEVGAPEFSPDSRRVAYFAERAGKELIVVDGVEGRAYDTIERESTVSRERGMGASTTISSLVGTDAVFSTTLATSWITS